MHQVRKPSGSLAELSKTGFDLMAVPSRVEPTSILMCEPDFFDVIDCKNPFMQEQAGKCDTSLAKRQWLEVKCTFERLGYEVHEIPPASGVEDMVFSANQALPGQSADGRNFVVLSNMVHPSRRREIPFYAEWFKARGYDLLRLSESDEEGPRFEGQGDAIWHPSKKLLWGGYGHRSEKSVYEKIAELTGVDVLLLHLVKDRFYHLDTAFCALDIETVMIYPPAFAAESLELIRSVFKRVLELNDKDANNFAANGFTLGRHVVLQQGSEAACDQLRAAGFTPVEVDTSEFMKSGGSVFCLKMTVY